MNRPVGHPEHATGRGRHVRVGAGASTSRLADLSDVGRAIAGVEGLDDLLRVVTDGAQALIGTHQAVTTRLVDGWDTATTHVSLSDKYAEYRTYDEPPQGLGVLNAVTRENRPLRLNPDELVEHPEWRGLRDAPPGHPPLPDYLAAPLTSRDGRNIGLIQLSDKVDGSKFTEEDEGLLTQLAQMASATLEHVELLERERSTRRQLEEHAAEARLAAAVGIALTSDAPLAEQLHRCAQALVDHLDVAFGRIWTMDAAQEVLVLQASAGMYTHLDGDHARVAVGSYKIGRIAARRQPHLTNDVATDPEISDPEWAAREGMAAFAGYPLIVKDRVIGVLALFARRELPVSTLEALSAVADVIAVGIEQSRASAQLRWRATQMRRLARTAARVNASDGLEAILTLVTEEARGIIGAHQSISSLTQGTDWSQAITTVSLSDRYAAWHDYEEMPDGSGIYAHVCAEQEPLRLTQAELEAHPLWRGFGEHAAEHPPMRGWLAVPLTAPDGTNLGLLQLSDKDDGEFTEEDEAILVQLAEIAASAIHNTRLYEDRARVAAVLQQSLLPPSLPRIPGVELAARYRAGTEDVGGDFYDVFPLRGRAWGAVIGDVRGKGPAAAALTALARHSTRAAAMSHRRPQRVLAVTNEALHDDAVDPERFCSAAFLRITPGEAGVRVDVASGGHPPLLVVRTDGEVEFIEPTGPLIGLFPDIELGARTLHLAPGDVLVAYTDGITEARRGDRLFGTFGLVRLLTQRQGADAETIAGAVVDAAAAFSDQAESDDAAVVVLRAEDVP